jgi:hypothetical protein
MTNLLIDQAFEPSEHLPAVDQRADPRHRTLLQVARLATIHGDELCILRNVSPGGLRAEVYCTLAAGDPVEFELKTGRRVAGTVVWAEGTAIGVQFDRRVPILSYLAHQAITELGRRVRAPRVHIGEQAVVRVAEREFDVEVIDASQAGMRIRTDRVLFAGGACQVMVNGLGERGALVRWCHDGEVGLQLKRPLAFNEFAAWRKQGKRAAALH